MIAPENCAVFSAFGALLSDYRRSALRSCAWRVSGDPRMVAEALSGLEARVTSDAREAGVSMYSIHLERTADMRFIGQTSELSVPLPQGPIDPAFATALRDNFRTQYVRAFGAGAFWADAEPEVVNLRVTAVAPSAVTIRSNAGLANSVRPATSRKVFWPFDMAFFDWTVRDRGGLAEGSTLTGPVIVESADTTIVIPPGCTAFVNDSGSLIIQIAARDHGHSH
jgi:N-methylhydantoinase A